jgi:hypothetical protein|tara:strand:+ start:150 stop:827 length:678 start_codon:yes stop_codon:yes gene_type:complete
VNYTQLFETIKSFCENDFPDTEFTDSLGGATTNTSTEQINKFIDLAEQKIYNSVQILSLRKTVTGSLTQNNRYLQTPTDWLSNFSLALIDSSGIYHYLMNKDVNFIREAFPDPTATARPTHYALFDKDTFIVGPTPDTGYTAELYYFYYPESIVTATNTWLGDNYDSALLYGALLEAQVYMKGEQDVFKNYMDRYNEALSGLKTLSEGKNRQDTYRTKQNRVGVG